MDTIQKVALIVHTLIALLIIALVLLQRGKGADAGAAFGAGASGTVFGARGSSSFFSRATAVCATLFFVSSLALAYLSSQASTAPSSLLENAPPAAESSAGEVPEPSEELPISDTPELEPVEDQELDIPELEDEEPTGDQG
jgi:preprotein translocase subunit SecG